MSMKPADVAIQIVNYRTKIFLQPLLESIVKDLAGSGLAVEINILDNASGDDLSDIGEKFQKDTVHIYSSLKNGGFGAGHNLLAHKTQARRILMLNPDMLFTEENTIGRLIDTMELTSAAVVGPRLVTPRLRSDTLLAQLSADALKQQVWDHGSFSLFARYHIRNHATQVAWVSGAAFLIDRPRFQQIGGFDEKYFLYYEEVDLCYRLRVLGAKIVYDPSVQILHYGGAATKKGRRYNKYITRSFFRFHTRHLLAKKYS